MFSILLLGNWPIQSFCSETWAQSSLPDNQNIPLDFSLGENRNLSVKMSHDTALGNIALGQYAQTLSKNAALGLNIGGGENEYLAGISGVIKFSDHDLIKGYAEYLNQSLSYDFDSGDAEVRTWQETYVIQYKHFLQNTLMRDFNFEINSSHASSKSLSSIQYVDSNGDWVTNSRRVAGGNEQGAQVGTTFTLSFMTLLEIAVGYQRLMYDLDYSSDSNTYSATGSATITQAITSQFGVKASVATEAAYNSYGGGVDYCPFDHSDFHLNFSVMQLIAKNISSENSTTYFVNGIWNIDGASSTEKTTNFTLPAFNLMSEAIFNPTPRVNTKVDQKTTTTQPTNLTASLTSCSFDSASPYTLSCSGNNLLVLGDSSSIYRHYSGSSCPFPGFYNSPSASTFTNTTYVAEEINVQVPQCNLSLCNNSTCSDKETNTVPITAI